jgi:hypothetical protein
MRVRRALFWCLAFAAAGCLAACSSRQAPLMLGQSCVLNSDCNDPPSCKFGKCHRACVETRDCDLGQRCVKVDGVGVCQLPVEMKCAAGVCPKTLVCGPDDQCLNSCTAEDQCLKGQHCGSNVCVDLNQGMDGGTDTPANGGDGSGRVDAGAGDAPTDGPSGGDVSAPDTNDASAEKVARPCSPACPTGSDCIDGTCTACGNLDQVCCTGTCGMNLTCAAAKCVCGGNDQACCGGNTCATGYACTLGKCVCGGAGQACCPDKSCGANLQCSGAANKCTCAQKCEGGYYSWVVLRLDGAVGLAMGGAGGIVWTAVRGSDGQPFNASGALDVASDDYGNTNTTNTGCVVRKDGTVWCWGSNGTGRLGAGLTDTQSASPVQVRSSAGPLVGITQIVGGHGAAFCALGDSGKLWCWGYGLDGKLGNGFETNSAVASPVLASSGGVQFQGVSSVTMGFSNACAVKSDGTVWCWGGNTGGAVGTGTVSTSPVLFPTQVNALLDAGVSVGCGGSGGIGNLCCASKKDGTVWCWGRYLGTDHPVPFQLSFAAGGAVGDVSRISTGSGSSEISALRQDGSVLSWTDVVAPAPKTLSSGIAVAGVTYFDNGCAITSDGLVNGSSVPCN